MARNNPFCLSFGREPDRFVERLEAQTTIYDVLESDSPASNSFLITGVRGSGKTVLMASTANKYRETKDWVVVSLNPVRDLLQMMAASLYEEKSLQKAFIEASIDLSKFGIGLKLKKVPPISDIQIAISKMVEIAAQKGKKILITIDDITKSDNIIAFASAYQDLISRNYPVFLIMTGLYENVYLLQNDKRCSFLMRAEKLMLKPLNITGMANQYIQTFACSQEEARRMALFTRGYSYAFQVLGYIMWDKECSLEEAIPSFDERMGEYCYDKIWGDLSGTEKKMVSFIAHSEKGRLKAKELVRLLDTNSNSYSVHRDRLVKKGVLDGSEYGAVSLALPRFGEYVKTLETEFDY